MFNLFHLNITLPSSFNELFLIFIFSSIFGWIVESVYVSLYEKKVVSSGLLFSPIIPIYGLGAVSTILSHKFFSNYINNTFIELLIFTLFATIIEYIGSYILEKFFGLKLWDYSDRFLNIKGRVCLLYSTYWFLLIFVYLAFVYPYLYYFVKLIENKDLFVKLFSIQIVLDLGFTIYYYLGLKDIFKKFIPVDFEEIINRDFASKKIVSRLNRLSKTFPNIIERIKENTNKNLEGVVISKFKNYIKHNKLLKESNLIENQKEFDNISNPIIEQEIYKKLKNYYHHGNSIYTHNIKVAKLAFLIAKKMNLDVVSVVRGALLHDFFFYDWRNSPKEDNRKRFHGLYHAKESYERASKYFELNKIEKDIIIKHMWPLNYKFPRYRESFVVSFADKIVASKQFFEEIKKNASDSFHKFFQN